ncbi:reactive intermediate/imine deaminase [Geoglobus ahangari]|uniref:Reactive intermediate/imine deaminase n=1 Tax=Geoglobus ahangari TaxID=113653 RepID=A0A0F7IDV7_9EURY|nr:Rid family detoxifying hydrolase [Geoglobus ahangari]AKG91689.1 reactive intermediate/imine deaminase [Geoglobus ahangari]
MEFVNSPDAPRPVGPYSHAVMAGDFVFVSGQIPLDKEGRVPESFEERVKRAIENVRAILRACGLDLRNVVKVTVYLRDISRFEEFNEVYARYFTHKPARAVVEVSNLPKNADVEIEVIAYAKS